MLNRQSLRLATPNQIMLVSAAGLLVNLFLLIVSICMTITKERWGYSFLAAVNAFMLFGNIIPRPWSDGGRLLEIMVAQKWIVLEADWGLIIYLELWSSIITLLSLGIMMGLFLRDLIPKIEKRKLQI